MTTYRLPEWLGGLEARLMSSFGDGRVSVHLVGEDIFVELDLKHLVEVKPPLPEEPPNWFVGRAGADVWQRDDVAARGHKENWWKAGDSEPYTWAAASEFIERTGSPLVELIPDPVSNAPALPWRLEIDDRVMATVRTYCGSLDLYVSNHYFGPDDAEQIALAILRAVRKVRKP